MKIHHYCSETKELVYSEDAIESPLEPGVYLIPANATDIKPGKSRKGFTQVFDGESWSYLPEGQSERLSAEIRARRDRLLQLCDWTQLGDISAGKRAIWAIYRQQLRDMPQQDGFPVKVKFPEPPER